MIVLYGPINAVCRCVVIQPLWYPPYFGIDYFSLVDTMQCHQPPNKCNFRGRHPTHRTNEAFDSTRNRAWPTKVTAKRTEALVNNGIFYETFISCFDVGC